MTPETSVPYLPSIAVHSSIINRAIREAFRKNFPKLKKYSCDDARQLKKAIDFFVKEKYLDQDSGKIYLHAFHNQTLETLTSLLAELKHGLRMQELRPPALRSDSMMISDQYIEPTWRNAELLFAITILQVYYNRLSEYRSAKHEVGDIVTGLFCCFCLCLVVASTIGVIVTAIRLSSRHTFCPPNQGILANYTETISISHATTCRRPATSPLSSPQYYSCTTYEYKCKDPLTSDTVPQGSHSEFNFIALYALIAFGGFIPLGLCIPLVICFVSGGFNACLSKNAKEKFARNQEKRQYLADDIVRLKSISGLYFSEHLGRIAAPPLPLGDIEVIHEDPPRAIDASIDAINLGLTGP